MDIQFLVPDAAQQLGIVTDKSKTDSGRSDLLKVHGDIESGLIAGFQLATAAGNPITLSSAECASFSQDLCVMNLCGELCLRLMYD